MRNSNKSGLISAIVLSVAASLFNSGCTKNAPEEPDYGISQRAKNYYPLIQEGEVKTKEKSYSFYILTLKENEEVRNTKGRIDNSLNIYMIQKEKAKITGSTNAKSIAITGEGYAGVYSDYKVQLPSDDSEVQKILQDYATNPLKMGASIKEKILSKIQKIKMHVEGKDRLYYLLRDPKAETKTEASLGQAPPLYFLEDTPQLDVLLNISPTLPNGGTIELQGAGFRTELADLIEVKPMEEAQKDAKVGEGTVKPITPTTNTVQPAASTNAPNPPVRRRPGN